MGGELGGVAGEIGRRSLEGRIPTGEAALSISEGRIPAGETAFWISEGQILSGDPAFCGPGDRIPVRDRPRVVAFSPLPEAARSSASSSRPE